MSSTFTLIPHPTFKTDVIIPRAGAEDGILTFTFRHKTRSQLETLEKTLRESVDRKAEAEENSSAPMVDFITDIADGWALPDAFDRDNVLTLLENYPRAFDAIATAYTRELMALREKNS